MRLLNFKRFLRHSGTLIVVSILLLASYITGGRILMSIVSGDASFFEGRIVEYTGVPVSVDSLGGSFDGLNPKLRVDGLRLLIGASDENGNASALVFDSATVVLDMWRSLVEKRWILDDFTVETLEIIVEQSIDGQWRLAGLGSREGSELDFYELFQSLRRVSYLNLSNVSIKFVTNQGANFSLVNGTAAIQNRGNSHFLHIDANLDDSDRLIAFSFEVTGDELDEIDGKVHVQFPHANYSEPFIGQSLGSFNIHELQGSGSFWVDIENGKFAKGVTEFDLSTISFSRPEFEAVTFGAVNGISSITFDSPADEWNINFVDTSLQWKNYLWEPFNFKASYIPSNSLSFQLDQLDVAFISELFSDSGFLVDTDGLQLLEYDLTGKLENLSVYLPLEEGLNSEILLKTNITGMDISSVGGSPALWGLNGYAQARYSQASKVGVGFAEIDSQEFRINLPKIFTNTWEYDRVNGRLNFRLDLNGGQELALASSVIFAESEAIDGEVMFALKDQRIEGKDREAVIEVIAGASRADAAYKHLYLPDGPNIKQNTRNTMNYLNEAILQGDISRGGVLYRGSSLPEATSSEKTFQSYFVLSDSEIRFSEEWPVITQISGVVTTDDNNIDITVDSGNSLGVDIRNVFGEIRIDELDQNWLRLTGSISGETSVGINYLQSAPLSGGLTETVSGWETEGGFSAFLNVDVPLEVSSANAEVRLDLSLENNSLVIPDYSLNFSNLSGPIVFDTKTGLEETQLSGDLFDEAVNVLLDSETREGEVQKIFVSAEGSVSKEKLKEWPNQSDFVRSVLDRAEGHFPYTAELTLNQLGEQTSHFLNITSDLSGVSLDLPEPLSKYPSSTMPLSLDFEFRDSLLILGNLGEQLNFVLEIDDALENGIVYFGNDHIELSTLMNNEPAGVTVLGNINRVVVEDWTELIANLDNSGNQSAGLNQRLALVDVVADIFQVYDQELPSVNIRVQEDSQDSLMVNLISDSIQGEVLIPSSNSDYLEIDLDYLRLEGEDEGDNAGEYPDPDTQDTNESYKSNTSTLKVEEEEEDPLLSIDPRLLPRLRFSTDEFSIGSRSYGSWSFSLNPNEQGASFDDLVFDFRGLRLGMEGPYVDGTEVDEYAARFAPSFTWNFSGVEHSSSLTGIIYADDMADVLTSNGYAASIESEDAIFFADISWAGSPAYFAGSRLSGEIDLDIDNGRFQQGSGGQGALRLISILNFDAIMRRARLSDDLVRTGFAYDEIEAQLTLRDGQVEIEDRLVISGPSSLYQITGELDLREETITGEMFVTLPFSDNIPWLGLLTANLPLAVGAYLFDQIFGDQVDSLTSAVYTLSGPWEELEPEFKQAFGSPDSPQDSAPQ